MRNSRWNFKYSKLDFEPFCKLLHRVVDGVCGRSGPRQTDYGDRWSLSEWVELMDTLSSLIRFAVGRGCSDQEVSSGESEQTYVSVCKIICSNW